MDASVEPMPPILADATAAREIVFNLLSNASKYSDDNTPIVVAAQVNGGNAEVAVRNHGKGVTPGETAKIFEKFHRGETFAPRGGARAVHLPSAHPRPWRRHHRPTCRECRQRVLAHPSDRLLTHHALRVYAGGSACPSDHALAHAVAARRRAPKRRRVAG